ncbi:AP-5 complex subunit sigma-1 isoform X3 [Boleophthalmus pectinirostris]|uniref:AP-5 complex subunit sigma-1 isoform X3 n=1 Tax=Boleophthalmus pectinirostris TaxID=150288 RepID=UPI00242F4C76|nr:AP-5 complex subunit sigma-1 isoform X3 [Boleophthalmus pectinirostris]
MVRCFLIHTVCGLSALGPGDSRVLYSRVFGPDQPEHTQNQNQEQKQELSPEERRLLLKERVTVVARQVRSAVSLSRDASGQQLVEVVPGEEGLALQEADVGVVRLRVGQPFSGETSALWLAVLNLGFTLVCDPHDNLLLAEGTLRTLARLCVEHLHLLGQGSEVLLKSNRIDFLLSRLLPHGQLLFLNHKFAQSLEKEVALYMTK